MMMNGGRSSSRQEIEAAQGSTASIDKRKRLADHKREKKKQAKAKRGENGEIVVDEGNDGPFYLVESIVGERFVKGKKEYLVQWKNVQQMSWEPIKNLCDSAYRDALRFSQHEAERRAKAESTELLLGIGKFHSKVEEVEYGPVLTLNSKAESLPVLMPSSLDERTFEDTNASDVDTSDVFRWTDEEQIEYREVIRIDVHEDGAKDRVKEARLNGTPIVLVGHKGFPQFASRWLKREPGACPAQDNEDLDLTLRHEVDVHRMIADIGTESVPILRKNYDESNPIEKEIYASTFLEKCWPAQGSTSQSSLYLHQWQFPSSGTASPKLCGEGRCVPFPNEILGEDMLQFWLDKNENPYQYIFMGGDGTMSKLHRDTGGLDIFIAPIVGEKECVLVHRADGDDCMYKLEAKLDRIDLHRFPMMRFARVWKTVVCPGEVLFMPQGTYHQCRNVTACLSYSR
jgi:hypothetical protein